VVLFFLFCFYGSHIDNKKFMGNLNFEREEKVVSLPIRVVPFYNTTDTTRLQMISKYFTFQAIPSTNSELPVLISKDSLDLSLSSNSEFVKIAPKDGEVLFSNEDYLIVQYFETGEIEIFEVPEYKFLFEKFGTKLKFKLEPGARFFKGDVIFEYCGYSNGYPAPGYNAKVLFGAPGLINHNDAVVVSESFAKKMGWIFVEEYIVPIFNFTKLFKNEQGKLLPEVGDRFNPNEVILSLVHIDGITSYIESLEKEERDDRKISKLERIKRIVRSFKIDKTPMNYRDSVIQTEYPCYVQSVEVIKLDKKGFVFDDETENLLSELSYEFEEKVEDSFEEIAYSLGEKMARPIVKYLYGAKTGKYRFSDNRAKGLVYALRIKVVNEHISFKSGDKISTMGASKGVSAIVVPDSIMPKTKDGAPVDIFISPLSIPSRMTINQVYEFYISKLVKTAEQWILKENKINEGIELLKDIVKNLISDEEIKKMQLKYLERAQKIEPELKKFLNEIKKNGLHLIVDSYKEPDAYDLDTVHEIYKKWNIPTEETVVVNPRALMGYLTNHKLKEMPNEEIEIKCSVGYMYIINLKHIASSKINARSIGKYSQITRLAPRGRKLKGGSRLGNDEIAMLFSYDTDYVIKEFTRIKADDHRNKKKFLLAPIYKSKMFKFNEDYESFQKPYTLNVLESYLNLFSVSLEKDESE